DGRGVEAQLNGPEIALDGPLRITGQLFELGLGERDQGPVGSLMICLDQENPCLVDLLFLERASTGQPEQETSPTIAPEDASLRLGLGPALLDGLNPLESPPHRRLITDLAGQLEPRKVEAEIQRTPLGQLVQKQISPSGVADP